MKKHLHLVPLFLFLFITICQGQNFDYTAPAIIVPPSPDVASLMKFTDIPVSYFTGMPQISFPIHTLKSPCANVNIGISYNTSGIKVEEESTWVGLGWNLIAGGAISRSVVGKPDEFRPGYRYDAQSVGLPLYTAANPYSWLSNVSSCEMLNISNGNRDVAPDIYYLNFNGYSAKMYFDQNGMPFITPYKAWKVEGNETSGFAVTVENGTRYEFDIIETTSSDITSGQNSNGSQSSYNSSWFLSKIKSPNGADSVVFNYTPVSQSENDRIEETWSDLQPGYTNPCSTGGPLTAYDREQTTISTSRNTYVLSSIESAAQRVLFIAQNGRQDFSSLMLGEIQVIDKINNVIVKDFLFDHNYFGNASSSNTIDKRLMLTDYKEVSSLGTLTTSFGYINPQSIPVKNSKAQDNWGYYNGATNSSLIPAYYDINGAVLMSGADRDSKPILPATGLLNQITYPSGGIVSFNYETNDYAFIKNSYINKNHQLDSTLTQTTASASTSQLGSTSSGTISTTVTIPANSSVQSITYRITGRNPSDPLAEVSITENGNGIFGAGTSNGTNASAPAYLMKPGHTYVLSAERDQSSEYAFISVIYYKNVVKSSKPSLYSRLTGGARIKSIIEAGNPDSTKNITKQFIYTLRDSVSSGVINNIPVYEDITYTPVICQVGSFPAKVGDAPYFNRHSTSMNALGSTQGSIVGYSKVTVIYGTAGENGKEEFYYSTTPYDEGGNGYPYIPFTNYDDLRGMLLRHIVYDKNGIALKKTLNTYSFHQNTGDPNQKWIFGAKFGVRKRGISYTQGCPNMGSNEWEFDSGMYKMYQFWPVLTSTTDSLLDRQTNLYQVNNSTFAYSPVNLEVIRQAHKKSNGDSLSIAFNYPQDYSSQSVYAAMLSQHILDKQVTKTVYTNTNQTYLEQTNFNMWTYSLIAPASIYTQYGANNSTSRYNFYNYDKNGNVLEDAKSSDSHTTYLWGYNYQYPVAEIKNATYQQVLNVLGQATIDQLNNSPGTDPNVQSLLAPLRSALPQAQVTTYTYAPLVGMTSMTDAKGMTTYYEYDSMQRLMNVKDKDGNVVKHLDYHYANQ